MISHQEDSGNQEDSVMLNKSSVDRGMFVHTCFKTLQLEENKKTNCTFEKIEVPPSKSQNNTLNYSKLGENGIIKKGTPIVKGDIIIGKTLTKIKTEFLSFFFFFKLFYLKNNLPIISSSWKNFLQQVG